MNGDLRFLDWTVLCDRRSPDLSAKEVREGNGVERERLNEAIERKRL